MAKVEPEGIFLWVATDSDQEERDLLKRVARWTGRAVR